MTIGIVAVARFAAAVALVPAVTRRLGPSRTSSATRPGSEAALDVEVIPLEAP
jgi:hypothetical protein